MNTKTRGQYTQYGEDHWHVSGNCPSCFKHVVYQSIGIHDAVPQSNGQLKFGHRRCPDPKCGQHVFFVSDGSTTVCYPPEKLDFDATDIPKAITTSLTEAIACHAAECYVASALMVRRTLEELCKDRGATGDNLKERIASLGTKVLLPAELLQALDALRLLGNDAAHIESQEYDNIGKPEVEIAVSFTKEVLKAVYQYAGLLAKLKSLKKQPTP
jgi:hypothetical protein